ncbi:hypothetical protein CRYUN_Cryun37aG0048200 [Craigia yunnanensis]
MASLTTSLPPPLFLQGRKTLFRTLQNLPVSSTGETQNCAVIVKATSDSSESSTSLSIVKSVQNIWFIYRYLLFKPDRFAQQKKRQTHLSNTQNF